jgi:DNA repair exonuclease SbcCD ATPase subunit
MSRPRDLLSDFDSAARGPSVGRDRPVPKPSIDPLAALRAAELSLGTNLRSLDSVSRRLAVECDDRLVFINNLRNALAEEERSVLQRRRYCDDLIGTAMKQKQGVDSLTNHFQRKARDEPESLTDREKAVDERISAVLRRVDEVADLFRALDEKERATIQRGAELMKQDEELDRQQRQAQEEAKSLKVLEYDVEDRRRALERRQDAIALWEARLDRREADIIKLERGVTRVLPSDNAKAIPLSRQAEPIDRDDDDDEDD